MKKILLPLALIVAATMPASARSLSPAEALGRAINSSDAPARIGSMRIPAKVVPSLTLSDDTNNPLVYVIDRPAQKGYMIVAADDVAAPLLGYADSGSFDPDNMPANLRWWLSIYQSQIARAVEEGAKAYAAPSASWRPEIAPKLTTKWDQGAPYYNMCPTVAGARTYTGCVATAMAQVVNWHKYPEKGIGTHSYEWAQSATVKKTLSFDYANTTFDYSKMLDVYTSSASAANANAVATLMYACGVSIDMAYGVQGSAAATPAVAGALRDYFGYDKGINNLYRDCMSPEAWDEAVYNELSQNGPVIYSGSSPEVGHCFVCDGYMGGYYHFNWGWSGMSDGYFMLNALSPDAAGTGGGSSSGGNIVLGYNEGQSIIVGVKKPVAGSTLPDPSIIATESANIEALGSTDFLVTGPFFNYSPYTVSGKIRMTIINMETEKETITEKSVSDLGSGSGYYYFIMPRPAEIGNGEYAVYLDFVDSSTEKEYEILTPGSRGGFIYLNITDNGLEGWSPMYNFTAQIDAVSDIVVGKEFAVDFTFNNLTDRSFYLPVYPALANSQKQLIALAYPTYLPVYPGENKLQYIGSWQQGNPNGGTLLTLGTTDGLYTKGDQMYYANAFFTDLFSVSVNTSSSPDNQLTSRDRSWEVVDASDVTADNVKIKGTCRPGFDGFSGTMVVRVYSADGNTEVGRFPYYMILTESMKKTEFSFSFNFYNGVPGTTYKAELYVGNTKFTNDMLSFTIGKRSGIDDIVIGSDEDNAEYYNLQGVRIFNPAPGTLVIRKTGDKAEKIVVK